MYHNYDIVHLCPCFMNNRERTTDQPLYYNSVLNIMLCIFLLCFCQSFCNQMRSFDYLQLQWFSYFYSPNWTKESEQTIIYIVTYYRSNLIVQLLHYIPRLALTDKDMSFTNTFRKHYPFSINKLYLF